MLKEDSNDPSVKLLHHFATALWNEAPSMDAFMDIGKTINDKMVSKEINSSPENNITPSTGVKLAATLRHSRKVVAKEQWTDHGGFNRAMYAITHPRQALGSMASTGGNLRIIPSVVGAENYDSHGALSNNPSLQGVSKYSIQNGEENYAATVNNCYGGSPTIDNEISPEFLAVLQASENNQFAEEIDEAIPQMVNYTNLQNISHKKGEGARSIAIMQLNDRYPLSFFGMTLTKDAAIYKMAKPEDVVYDQPSQFGSVLKQHFMQSFEPGGRVEGYYFPGNKEAWEPVFDQVIENANEYFNQIPNAYLIDAKTLQGAYQEYVYSMLNGVIEMETIKTLRERGINTPKVMTIKACKENIDRGGMENVKYMYTKLSKDQKDRDSLFIGCMHGRPLSARDRVILEDRMPQVLSFMELIEPEQFQEQMNKLYINLNYDVIESNFTPAISS